MSKHGLEKDYPGANANRPRDIPKRGWWQVSKRAWAESKTDQVPLLAAGVAFFSFLSLFPMMIAAVTVYGLVADRQTVVLVGASEQIAGKSALQEAGAALAERALPKLASTGKSKSK